jgi:ferredoxin/flavodoxin---NADP+ reductase
VDRGTVFVVGAGPAGIYATRKIAAAGYRVIIFNRDIKSGGLAEYGIYPQKHHMKQGLRKQFSKILDLPNVSYVGNVPVREGGTLTVGELRQWNPSAIVFAVGAQGTKKLGLPGEDAKGLYSAKDFVFFYNQLPPFTSRDFSTGRRVAIVGMGNVMVDIARWLLLDMPGEKPEEVVVIARRGPFEVKFDEKEFDHIEMFLNRKNFREELQRIEERLKVASQDIGKVSETVFPWLNKDASTEQGCRLNFRFLTSPVGIESADHGRISKLRVVENLLVPEGGTTKAKATGDTSLLEFDTLIFAIGDEADPSLGLPFGRNGYFTNPDTVDSDRAAYEVFDPQTGRVLEGHYVVGWARKASEGLVGKARFDAEHGCDFLLKYLAGVEKKSTPTQEEIFQALTRKGLRFVDKEDLAKLGRAEEACAHDAGLPEFRFSTNERMLAAIEAEEETPHPAREVAA